MTTLREHPRFFFVALVLSSWSLASCRAPVPASDSTPPEITVYVKVADGDYEVLPPEGDELEVDVGDDVAVWAIAKDGGGIKRVQVDGGGKLTCKSGSEITVTPISFREFDAAPATTGVGDVTETSRGVILEIDGAFSGKCPAGASVRSANVDFDVKATNFHSGTTTGPALSVHWN